MKSTKRKQLEAAGWKVGSAAEFLALSPAETMLINMKLELAKNVRELRLSKKLTQGELARLIGSSQSRVAKLEVADSSVSLELLVRSLAALGATPNQIGKIVAATAPPRKAIVTKTRRAPKRAVAAS
jgi:predicted transcriptional regulator